MKIRSASLFAIVIAASATPAFGQDAWGDPPPLPDQEWREDWDAGDYPPGPDEAGVSWRDEEWRDPGLPEQPYAQNLGYSAEEREAWLAECRRAYRHDDRSERRGEVIGGVIGGVGGAIVGSRLVDRSRLGGALIGGGVGALAGSAIGGEIGEDADRDRAERRFDECEEYLARYEQGYGVDQGYVAAPGYDYSYPAHGYGPPPHGYGAYGYGAYGYGPPVMWVKVPIVTERRRRADCGCRPQLVEEVVEERIVAPPPEKRVKIQRVAPPPSKNTKVTKTVRYSK